MSDRDHLLIMTFALGAFGGACLIALVWSALTDGKARNEHQDPPEILPIDDIGYDRRQP